jgi:glycosyltransferase involved in cell wall biosynthesis
MQLARSGPAPLSPGHPSRDEPLEIAIVIPSFRCGSGGHATIVHLMHGLKGLGHSVSIWLEDCEGRHAREPTALTKSSFAEFFDAQGLELHVGFDDWSGGADVVLATGWQTVARALLLPGAKARAYLVQDHEPDFYGASAERLLAEDTYRRGLHCIAASPWLAGLLRERYGASATHFDLAVDHAVYRPTGGQRREKLVVFYARAVTARRAVPLGLLALAELSRRRPDVEIALFGEDRPLDVPFEHTNLGVLPASELAALYSRATVGMVFSLTNPSLIGLEMMASGLPCVELASESMVATFGTDGPLELVAADPITLCAGLDRLLGDPIQREVATRAGTALLRCRDWERAALLVEEGLRTALRC